MKGGKYYDPDFKAQIEPQTTQAKKPLSMAEESKGVAAQ